MLLFLFATVAILFSFLCSIWEAVLLSIPNSYVEIKKTEGSPIGTVLENLKKDIDRPLSAILSLNTIAHTVGSIGVGAMVGKTYGEKVVMFGQEMPFTPEAVAGAVMTLLILVLSEIIPKTLGATKWKLLAPFTARSMRVVMLIMAPFVALSKVITKWLKGSGHEQAVSREDLTAIAQIGHRDGIFEASESKIIRNLMRFNVIEARSIMTPRTVVMAAPEDQTVQEFYEKNTNQPFSRIPVYRDSKDNITGFVLKDMILIHLIKGEKNKKLKELALPIEVIQEDQLISDVFNTLLSERSHLSLVVDSYGGMAGVISLEDVIETLLGLEIVDEMDSTEDMQRLARQNWEKRAAKMGLIKADSESESE